MSLPQHDVAVIGGGLVGASLALALARRGRSVALIEGGRIDCDGAALEQGWDARIYAISPKNRDFLASLDAWPDMARVGTVEAMDVRGDRGGRLRFSAGDAGGEALAYIAENRWMLASLWRQLAGNDAVTRYDRTRIETLEHEEHGVRLTLSDGRELGAMLAVGADGANSWVRSRLGVPASVKPYRQSGVVANFSCELPHGGVARQWFLGDGVLAWLPLPGNRISVVWSTFDPDRLTALDDAALAAEVASAGGHALGALQTLTPATAFPLRLIRPEGVIALHVALAGDAAHTVHPLAGQGVNLGFQDAALLADLAGSAANPGEWALLRRYQRGRREAVMTMQLACDGLFELFHRQEPGVGTLRNLGLSLVDRLGPLKRQLARHAVGY